MNIFSKVFSFDKIILGGSMIYLFFLYHILIFIDCHFLFKKRMRKSSMILGIINLLTIIVNLIEWWGLFENKTVSSVVYFGRMLSNNFFFTFLSILTNIILIVLYFETIKKAEKKQKQNKILKAILHTLSIIEIIFFTSVLFSKNADFILFIYIVGAFIYILKRYIKNQKNYLLASLLILLIFSWYSYGTYEGAARLQIALVGYPTNAYEMGLEEQKYYQEKNSRKYVPIKQVEIVDGDMGIIEVKNYLFLKFGTYEKY